MLFGIDLPGYVSLMVSGLFLSGIQLISLGVLGEYVGRIFTEVKKAVHCFWFPEQLGFERRPGAIDDPAARGGAGAGRGEHRP